MIFIENNFFCRVRRIGGLIFNKVVELYWFDLLFFRLFFILFVFMVNVGINLN